MSSFLSPFILFYESLSYLFITYAHNFLMLKKQRKTNLINGLFIILLKLFYLLLIASIGFILAILYIDINEVINTTKITVIIK